MTGAGLAQASKVGSLLSVLVSGLVLFIATVPIIASRLNTLSLSEFVFRAEPSVQTCITPTLCLRFFDGKVEHTAPGYEISMYLEGLGDLYQVAKAVDAATLKVVLADAQERVDPPPLRPKYDLYFPLAEVYPHIPISRLIPAPPPPQ